MKKILNTLLFSIIFLNGYSQLNTYSISKNLNYSAGTNDYIKFGSISNVSTGTVAKFRINGHSCSFLFVSEFQFLATYYANTTEWLRLPIANSNDFIGVQQLSFEVRTVGHGQSYELRLRRVSATGCAGIAAPISIFIETNGVYSDLPSPIQGTETATIKFHGSTAGWQFPVSTTTFAPTENGLFVKTNGSVGIGTTEPSEKLNVVGNIQASGKILVGSMTGINVGTHALAVNGSIISTKVLVKTTGNWPDYVFQPTYNLRSLSSVEEYIKQFSHLPDVPSAKEVEKGGVDLGATQAALLRKIEELTLYVIELNRKIEKLEAKK